MASIPRHSARVVFVVNAHFKYMTTTKLISDKRTSCSQNPCLNDGHCIETSSGSYECVCKPGFSGMTCAGKTTYHHKKAL